MSTVARKSKPLPRYAGPRASFVYATESHLTVSFVDGRQVAVPLAWYPRLQMATPSERADWELVGDGVGIRWPDLDEDVSAEGVVSGLKSGESKASFARWLKHYQRGERGMDLELWKLNKRPVKKAG